jgi:hypothetical protein
LEQQFNEDYLATKLDFQDRLRRVLLSTFNWNNKTYAINPRMLLNNPSALKEIYTKLEDYYKLQNKLAKQIEKNPKFKEKFASLPKYDQDKVAHYFAGLYLTNSGDY